MASGRPMKRRLPIGQRPGQQRDVLLDARSWRHPHRRPRHFGKSGTPINEYPLENCIVQGICIDLRHIAPRAEITPSDLEAAVKKAGAPVPKKGTVLLCTGHHVRTFPTAAYSTDNPGVNVAATEWLAKQGGGAFLVSYSMRPGPEGRCQLARAQGLPRTRHHAS